MSNVGFATLQVLPSLKNLQKNLQKDASPVLAAWSKQAGKDIGDTISEAASSALGDALKDAVGDAGDGGGRALGEKVEESTRDGAKRGVRAGVEDGAKEGGKTARSHLTSALRDGFRSGFKAMFVGSRNQGSSLRRSLALGVAGGLMEGARKGYDFLREGASKFFDFLSEGASAAGKTALTAISGLITGAATTAATGGLNILVGALLAVAAAIPAVVVGFLALAPVLSLVGGLLGATTTLLFGAGAAVGVVALASRGLGDAFTEMSEKGKLSKETLKKIHPEAAKFVVSISKIKKELGGLSKFVQGKLFAGLGPRLVAIVKTWKGPLKSMLGELSERLNAFVSNILDSLEKPKFIENVKAAVSGFGDFIEKIGVGMGPFIEALGTVARASVPFLDAMGDFIQKGILEKFANFIDKADKSGALANFMTQAAQAFKDIWAIGGLVFGILGDIIEILFPGSKKASDSVFSGVREFLQSMKEWLGDPKNQEALKQWISDLIEKVSEFVRKARDEWIPAAIEWSGKIADWVKKAEQWGQKFGEFKDKVSTALGAVKALLLNLAAPVGVVLALFARLPKGAGSEVGRVVGIFAGLPGRILGALGNLGGLLVGAGVSIAEGLAAGIRRGIGLVTGAGKALASAAAAAAKSALRINSPSKVFIGYGGSIAEGLATGMDRGHGGVTKAARALALASTRADWTPRPAAAASAQTAQAGDSHYHLHGSQATIAQLEALQARQAIRARIGRAR
ncbi:hypothetical protein [Micromonospora sediminicola]|uniref:hypothetical protein n=1 Tax=Micromonospora sediminicola TaxID=946078 RepID=UPI0037B49BF4